METTTSKACILTYVYLPYVVLELPPVPNFVKQSTKCFALVQKTILSC